MANSEKSVYMAKLAEQAELYDEMANYMEVVGKSQDELSVHDRNLLSVAYKNAVGTRRAALRAVTIVEQTEQTLGNEEQAKYAREYRATIEVELQKVCDTILGLLGNLIPKATTCEFKVFYQKMKADYSRYVAEITEDTQKSTANENARLAYEEAWELAEKVLSATHPTRLGLALNYSVFQYEMLSNPEWACKMVRTAFDDGIAGLDDVQEDTYRDSTLIMRLLRDNLVLWTSEQEWTGA